ncbi:hypothetical protein HaLaN_31018 [Haematococcus lacustris]|uniref:Uncharacterized protein n=1 Tax=Haematococcus lacustris TaxID=44745 RepID=A0A6A0AI04_HAELA|nr:hypothetical protein HaLaN_31018 [Haematococcus lacustris]
MRHLQTDNLASMVEVATRMHGCYKDTVQDFMDKVIMPNRPGRTVYRMRHRVARTLHKVLKTLHRVLAHWDPAQGPGTQGQQDPAQGFQDPAQGPSVTMVVGPCAGSWHTESGGYQTETTGPSKGSAIKPDKVLAHRVRTKPGKLLTHRVSRTLRRVARTLRRVLRPW